MDKDTNLSFDEFLTLVQESTMDQVFSSMEIDKNEAQRLFKILDRDGTGTLTPNEFARGALKLRGPSRAFDLGALRHESWKGQLRILEELVSLRSTLASMN